MKKILDKISCPYKAFLNSLNLVGEKEKSLEIAKLTKDIFVDGDYKDLVKPNEVEKVIEDWANNNPEIFEMDQEKDATTKFLSERFRIVLEWLDDSNIIIEGKRVNSKMKIHNEEVFHQFDLAYRIPGDHRLHLVNFYQSHPSAAANAATGLESGVEWHIKDLLAKNLYPNEDVIVEAVLLTANPKYSFSFTKNFIQYNDVRQADVARNISNVINAIQVATTRATSKNSPKCGDLYKDCDKCACRNLCEYYESNISNLQTVTVQKANSGSILTSEQESVNNNNPGIYRLLAGAGTGKTTTIANKVVTLLQSGVDKDDILLITFGEKSVQELKEKLDFWLQYWYIDELKAEDLKIYTFNGYANKIIEDNYQRFGYSEVPKLIDNVQKLDIIKALLDSRPQIDGLNYLNPIMRAFSSNVGAVVVAEEFIDNFMAYEHDPIRQNDLLAKIRKTCGSDDKLMLQIIDEFYTYLKRNNLITYDIQTHALADLTTVQYSDVLETYATPTIIVDEFQDTNKTQLKFLKALTLLPGFNSLTLCGDDSQSVYSWRGADKDIILSLEQEFPNLIDVKITENFRSTSEIVDLANKFNELDETTINKNLISSRHGKPVSMIDTSGIGSIEKAVELVKGYLANGKELHEIGIIGRKHATLNKLYEALSAENIPSFVSAHECFKDNPKVKALADFTKYLTDTDKTLYLAEFLQAKDNETFQAQASLEKYIGTESLRIQQEINGKTKSEILEYFMNILKDLAVNDRTLSELYTFIVNKNFNDVVEVSDYLSKLRRYEGDAGVEKDDTRFDAITLMTVHGAKGREFPIIIGLLDDFTTYKTNDSHQQVFVLITRAMDELVLLQDESHKGKYNIYFEEIRNLLI